MMWLSLIKSSERLNWNFSTKSQNRIGFQFGFCTHYFLNRNNFSSLVPDTIYQLPNCNNFSSPDQPKIVFFCDVCKSGEFPVLFRDL